MQEPNDSPTPVASDRKQAMRTWLKRLGWAGFLFFLIKGLIWLALGYIVLK